jgi:secreted trypsin-like serine protease
MRFKILLIFLLLCGLTPPVEAVLGGKPATSNPFVVALLRDRLATSSGGCSGALVAPRVVFTAAHCLGGSARSIWIPQPGTDLRDTSSLRIQGETFMVPSDFSSGTFPYNRDFGILILTDSFPGITPLTIASQDQIKSWIAREAVVLHIGYGCTELVESPPCRITSPIPNQFETTLLNKIPVQFDSLTPGTFTLTKISVEKTICGGDSGSPLLKNEDGKWIYIGAQSSSNGAGCTKTCNEICAASQGTASANPELITRMENYLNSSAASSTPSPSPSPAISQSPRPEEVSPSPSSSITSSPSVSANPKTSTTPNKKQPITITCLKGKLVKKVTGLNPKCPSGYKKK